jgi:hypothetical protein
MSIQRQSIDTNSPIRDCKPYCAPSLMVARAVDARIVDAPRARVGGVVFSGQEGSAESVVYSD